ncbi:YlbF family regulator [Vagococcus humatus]|uniref:YlbF family regulator n=1 Tax=Vagococcus humatus TaxID=1889241 RepID=A0A429Z6C8_9ENTE|nr:YlbF family regulator [Vagococcus humatus]RST89246.1 hypothetical protein C7P63_05575 [Vagococcus humatus]
MLEDKEKNLLDSQGQATLDRLIAQLKRSQAIHDYQEIEKKVSQHEGLKMLVEEIKAYQKQAVQFAHYHKPVAEKEAIKQADALTKQFDEHPLVIRYREKLVEANDVVQYITTVIEQEINHSITEDLNGKEQRRDI